MGRRLSVPILALTLILPAQLALAAGPGRSLPSFNESDGCQGPAGYRGPKATKTGVLSDAEPVYGPMGDFFGRTVGELRSEQVFWTVPGSGGARARVHRLALPAFEKVTENLEAAALDGLTYGVDPYHISAFYPRTVNGQRRISNHAFGIAVDINPRQNPYKPDNTLVTNMPDWFVDAWRDAGFCWGGDWENAKDAMHFSWKGPAHTPDYPLDLPVDKTPTSAAASWERKVSTRLDWRPGDEARFSLRDGDGDGSVDLYRLRRWRDGTLIQLLPSRKDYAECRSQNEWSPADFDAPSLLADFDNTSRMDLWTFDVSGAAVSVTVWLQRNEYGESVDVATAVPTTPGMQFEAGDMDNDGVIDLVVGRPGDPTIVEVWSGASGFTAQTASGAVPQATSPDSLHVSLTDHDRDGLADVVVAHASGAQAAVHVVSAASALSATSASASVAAASNLVAVEYGDFDGDGRDDIFTFDKGGEVVANLGGQLPGSVDLRRWFRDRGWTCPPEGAELPEGSDEHLPRLAGADRYKTAAAVSARFFPDGADAAIVASGLNFPDALAASPAAAALGGPVLLTHPSTLPSATAAEIRRLGATRVIIAGGPGAVADSVAAALADLPSVTSVDRVSGADRYGTAAALSSLIPPSGTVYVATGLNHPDALASAPAAAADGAPLLLVTTSDIPSPTRSALGARAPERIFVLGGPGAVSDPVVSRLAEVAPVERLAGPTRFSTAAEIATRLSDPEAAMIVNGLTFADAVAAGAAAASANMPIILIQPNAVPAESERYLADARPSSITIVGGPAAVSNQSRAHLLELVFPR